MQKFEADAKAKADAEIKALLDEAQKQGKVTADTRATFETVAQNSGVDALKTVLSSAKSTTKIVDFIKSENAAMAGATGGNKTWDWYQEHNPQALTQLEKEEPETFKALYQAKYNVKL
jgi:regulator of protease activity HflC (stomatin/prohibitin superfamily)